LEDRIKLIPLKRAGQPIDIARMVLFLASEAGDYITGEIFTVAVGIRRDEE
jgi:NAD(P)-dependent dehydrogenase (short-subunit alcohol dehydrogenase family)